MLKQTLLLTLMLWGIQSACSPGCSKCIKKDSEYTCEICDLSRFYYMTEDGKCESNALINCKIPSPTSNSKLCVQCNDEHFFDELAQECVAVPESKKNANCSVYSLVADCLRCKPGYIVENGTCVVPSNQISNCQFQISEEKCETCESGYQLNVARTTCLSFSTVNNCKEHQDFVCERCKADYTLAINWDLLTRVSLSGLQSTLEGEFDMAVALDSAKEDCVKREDSNCVTYDSYGHCAVCASGYHTDPVSGKCVLSRESEIFKCKKYSNVTTCAECEHGFYLTDNKCLERSLIDHCEKYTVSSNGCDQCSNGYYSAGSSCLLRNASANINYCKEYEFAEDKCKTCESDYILSTDKVKCFQKLSFCQLHTTASSTETLFCQTCEASAVPQNNTDTPPKILSCDMRDNSGCVAWTADNSNSCTTCLQGFYWLDAADNNLCKAYTKKCKDYEVASDNCAGCFSDEYLEINGPVKTCLAYTVKNCKVFEDNLNKCKECNAGYFINATTFECQPYTLINCKTPNPAENKCTTCNDDFYLADNVTCLPIDLWECKIPGADNQCTTCNDGFYLSDGKCLSGTQTGCNPTGYVENKDECTTCLSGFYNKESKYCLPYTVENCKGTTNDGFLPTEDGCEACLPGFFLFNDVHSPKNKRCYKIKIPNCLEANGDGTQCTKCTDGYEGTTECVLKYIPFCKDYSTTQVGQCQNCILGYELLIGNKECQKVEILYCKVYDQNANTCKTCQSGFQPDTARTQCLKLDVIGCTNYSNGICDTFDPKNFYKSSNDLFPKMPEFCLTPDTTHGDCVTCMKGYKLTGSSPNRTCVKFSTNGCVAYNDAGECQQCQKIFYYKSGDFSCNGYTKVSSNCMSASRVSDACLQCLPNYYINTTGTPNCTAITGTNLQTVNCYGNSGTVDTMGNVCNVCRPGSKKIPFSATSLIKYLEPAVLSWQTDGIAKQLGDDWYSYSGGYVKNINTTKKCIRIVPFTGALANMFLSTATKCGKCRNIEKQYLTGGNCTDRTASLSKCSIFNETADSCKACAEGKAYKGGGTINDCTEGDSDGTTNCKYTDTGTPGCYECYPDYLVNSNASYVCASNTTLKGCRVFDSSTPAECTVCKDNWYLDEDSKLCVQPDTCILGTSVTLKTYCKFCKPGFKPDPSSKYKCIRADSDDICYMYENLDLAAFESVCIKCKKSGTVPYNVKDGSNYKFRCLENTFGPMNESYIKIEGASKEILTPSLPDSKYGNVTVNGANGTAVNSICLPFDVPNCDEYDFANFHTPCSKCKVGYYNQVDGLNGQICVKGDITGCLTYSAADNCSECQFGWKAEVVAGKNVCVEMRKLPNCEVTSLDDQKCIKCVDGFRLRDDLCHKEIFINCKYYNHELEVCFGCDDGYYLKNNRCFEYTDQNCQSHARTEDSCNRCLPDFYLDEGFCKFNSSINCNNKSALGNYCLDCAENYFLRLPPATCTGAACFDPECMVNESINCLIRDKESPFCLVCEPNFFLTKGTCSPYTVQNCMIRDSEQDRCEYCEQGYYLNSVGWCEQYSLTNCQIMDANWNICKQCKTGYYQSGPGNCTQYTVKNCNVFHKSKNTCVSCLPGYYKNDVNDCRKYHNINNCQIVDPARDLCFSCKQGYFNDFGMCERYQVKNCELYKPDADLCMTCKKGYFLQGNTCESYSVRCEQYNLVKNECITCPVGYYLEEGICYVNNGLFCKELSPFRNGCKSCLDSFYLHQGQCKIREKSLNCKETIETADLCKSCHKTHFIAAGMCISYARSTCKTFDTKKDLCTACEEGKYWMSHNVCEVYTVDHCKTFSPTADKCLECELGEYYLSNGVCVKSTSVEECEIYSNTADECAECEDGYYLASGSECRRNPSGLYECIEYKDENTCSKCTLGFYLDGNYCQKSKMVIANCVLYSGDSICESCDTNYLIIENVCVEKVETTCAEWVDAENCLSCPANFVLKTNDSSKKVCEDSTLADCVEAEAGTPTNICKKCADKKILHNDACQDPVSPLTGCKVYKVEGECSECDDGFTLTKSANGCVANFSFMPANCAFGVEKSEPVCRSCMTGYHLNESRECVSCGGDGCNVCDPQDQTKCLFCKTGYDHDGSTCTQASNTARVASQVPDSNNSSAILVTLMGLLTMMLTAN